MPSLYTWKIWMMRGFVVLEHQDHFYHWYYGINSLRKESTQGLQNLFPSEMKWRILKGRRMKKNVSKKGRVNEKKEVI